MEVKMPDADLEKYCKLATGSGATNAKQIKPDSVVTADWVRWKCQFGCTQYGLGYCCPPDTPTPEQTRKLIDCYKRAILFHHESPAVPERGQRFRDFLGMLIDLEGEMFKDGYYKAFLLAEGPCRICKECAKLKDEPCSFGFKARPSMEGCGIDVFQTARNNGFFIVPLKEKTETQNVYCLMLVD
jgi:predicted metal-binding protein